MSSDSSDGENTNKLREAADFGFLNDQMFTSECFVGKKQIQESPPPLPRSPPKAYNSNSHANQYSLFKTTPEFRSHVAKHLSKILDEALAGKYQPTTIPELSQSKRRKKHKDRIKLFHDSPDYIKIGENGAIVEIRRKPNQQQRDDDDDIEEKCKEVAVSPEDILNKADTLHWSKRSKAPVYKYRKTERGLLVEEEQS